MYLPLSLPVTGAVQVNDLVPGHLLLALPALVLRGEGEGGVHWGGHCVQVRRVCVGQRQEVLVPGGGGGGGCEGRRRGELPTALRYDGSPGGGRVMVNLPPHLGTETLSEILFYKN